MSGTRLLVLFASETGNAQDVAASIAREARLLLFRPSVFAMDAFDVTKLPEEQLVVCVASTTGQGNHPGNMKRFWRFLLRKSLTADSLSHMQFAVFGLGDSGYQKYNVVAKKLHNRLSSLGGCALVEVGLGDDQHPNGYEAALDNWLPQLWQNLNSSLGFPSADSLARLQIEGAKLWLGKPKFNVELLPPSGSAASLSLSSSELSADWATEAVRAAAAFRAVMHYAAGLPPSTSNSDYPPCITPSSQGPNYCPWQPYMARMTTNRRITSPDHFQDTRHIEFNLGDSGLVYQPGDVLAIFPRTPPEVVEGTLQRFGWDGNAGVKITAADPPVQCSAPPVAMCSLHALVQGILDLAGASPRRYFFQVLSHFVASEIERERLEYFSSAEGRDDLYRYNNKERRSVWEVLMDFKSACPPLQWLLECCPLLQPRYFSLSSSQLASPFQAHITLAVVQWLSPTKRPRQGLCSSWLAGLNPFQGEVRVPVWVERGTLRMPHLDKTPMLMVGPGTGVAPFRSFLQHRHAARAGSALSNPNPAPTIPRTPNPAPTPSILFFGCRSQHQDFYYHDEWPAYLASGVLHPQHGLITAFSRDQPKKVYVTHRIQEHAALVWQLLTKGAVVFVSGSAEKMPVDVRATLCDVVVQEGGMSRQQGEKYLQQMELARRYQVETWS